MGRSFNVVLLTVGTDWLPLLNANIMVDSYNRNAAQISLKHIHMVKFLHIWYISNANSCVVTIVSDIPMSCEVVLGSTMWLLMKSLEVYMMHNNGKWRIQGGGHGLEHYTFTSTKLALVLMRILYFLSE